LTSLVKVNLSLNPSPQLTSSPRYHHTLSLLLRTPQLARPQHVSIHPPWRDARFPCRVQRMARIDILAGSFRVAKQRGWCNSAVHCIAAAAPRRATVCCCGELGFISAKRQLIATHRWSSFYGRETLNLETDMSTLSLEISDKQGREAELGGGKVGWELAWLASRDLAHPGRWRLFTVALAWRWTRPLFPF
jgi:hypothetical protein